MRSRRSLIIRLGLCVLLGAVTTWMVAWGFATTGWAGWFAIDAEQLTHVFAVEEPYLIERWQVTSWGGAAQRWHITRLDRDESISNTARVKLNKWREEPADAPPRQHPSPIWRDPMNMQELVGEAKKSRMTSFVQNSTMTTIHRRTSGWPRMSLAEARVFVERSPQSSEHWSLTLKSANRVLGMNPTRAPLRLPLQPIWTGFTMNTGFYGALWAIPLFGLPLLKQRRRRRKGHCPHCNYDLKRDLKHGCPECGWGKRANA